jgi:hypothetical protein
MRTRDSFDQLPRAGNRNETKTQFEIIVVRDEL